jgi:hypothetical protein
VETNRRRSREEFDYQLLDTGVFNGDCYFDVFVEYAKAGPEDILVQITATNRGRKAAELHVLPHLWFRSRDSLPRRGVGNFFLYLNMWVFSQSSGCLRKILSFPGLPCRKRVGRAQGGIPPGTGHPEAAVLPSGLVGNEWGYPCLSWD